MARSDSDRDASRFSGWLRFALMDGFFFAINPSGRRASFLAQLTRANFQIESY
jgi:hypothetical protein